LGEIIKIGYTKIIILFIFSLLISSCGRLDFGLQFFSLYVKSEVEDMFDLSNPQKELFAKNFSHEMEKVKQEEFPLYADYLEKILQAVEGSQLTAEKVSQFFDEGTVLFLQTPPQWKAAAQEVVVTLKPEQFKNFEEYFDKRIKKQKANSATAKDRQKLQLKFMNKWINETIEDLTKTQQDHLEHFVKSNPKPYELSIQSQEFIFKQFKEAFPEPEKRKIFIQTFLADWKAMQLPEYIKAHELYLEKLKDYVIDISLNLNSKQKKNLIENLRHRILELRKISQKSH
jgi:hypothetical protein